MAMAIFLTIVGLAFIALEFFVIGAVAAIVGGFLLIGGAVAFCFLPLSLLSKILYCLSSAFACFVLCKSLLWWMRAYQKNSYTNLDTQDGFLAVEIDQNLIGKEALAVSDLRPSGFVTIGKMRIQALSDGSYIAKGAKLVICGSRSGYYLVKKNIGEMA